MNEKEVLTVNEEKNKGNPTCGVDFCLDLGLIQNVSANNDERLRSALN